MIDPTSTNAPSVPARRRRYLPLLHRVASINVLLLLVAVGATIAVLVPGHESSYRIDEEGLALVSGLLTRLAYLSIGLALILVFVGGKLVSTSRTCTTRRSRRSRPGCRWRSSRSRSR